MSDHPTPTGEDVDFAWGLASTGLDVACRDAEAALAGADEETRDDILRALDVARATTEAVQAPLIQTVRLGQTRLTDAQWEHAREHLASLRQAQQTLNALIES